MGSPALPALGIAPDDASLLDAIPVAAWERNGVPSAERRVAMTRAHALVERRLRDAGIEARIRTSPLGAAWSRDIDVYVASARTAALFGELGWLPFRLAAGDTARRWLVVEHQQVLAAVDVHVGAPPDQGTAILGRARRRGEVRVREVLELRALARAGTPLPEDDVVEIAGQIERALGGSLLGAGDDTPVVPPVRVGSAAARRARRLASFPRRRTVIAISGVDGAGKSTFAQHLTAALEAGGFHVDRVWVRPGMRLGILGRLARTAKRALGQGAAPTVRRAATGEATHDLPSRSGIVGWSWALLVTLAFISDTWRRHLLTRGVVLYDRHLLDAVATLRFAYEGVSLGGHERLVRAMLPRATATLYLDILEEVAAARKPGDTIGPYAIGRQLQEYRRLVEANPDVIVLDATKPPADLVIAALVKLGRLHDHDHDGSTGAAEPARE